MVIECMDETEMNYLLEFDRGNWETTDMTMRVTAVDREMTGDEAMDYVTKALEVNEIAASWGPAREDRYEGKGKGRRDWQQSRVHYQERPATV